MSAAPLMTEDYYIEKHLLVDNYYYYLRPKKKEKRETTDMQSVELCLSSALYPFKWKMFGWTEGR